MRSKVPSKVEGNLSLTAKTKDDMKNFLLIVCGLPGSGKTSVARRLAELTGAELLRADVIRKELYEKPTYTAEEIDSVYKEMFLRVDGLLENGKNAVLDAAFSYKKDREGAEEAALKNNAPLQIFEVRCKESKIKIRMAARSNDESDADFRVYLKLKKDLEPFKERHIIINNSGILEDTYRQIEKIVAKVLTK